MKRLPAGKKPTGTDGAIGYLYRINKAERREKIAIVTTALSLAITFIVVLSDRQIVWNYAPRMVAALMDPADGTAWKIGHGESVSIPKEVSLADMVKGRLQQCITYAFAVPPDDKTATRNKDYLYNGCLLSGAQSYFDDLYKRELVGAGPGLRMDPDLRNDHEVVSITARNCFPITDFDAKGGTFECEWTEEARRAQHTASIPAVQSRHAVTMKVTADMSLAPVGSELRDKYDNPLGIMIESIWSMHLKN